MYTVNWISKIITIPASSLTLISGSEYNLDMRDFLEEIRRLEYRFDEGLWADQILDHTSAKVLSGTSFAPFDEIINGYTIRFEAGIERVNLIGSNNNIIDVLVYTGVSVIPSNSAGLISVGNQDYIQNLQSLLIELNSLKNHVTAMTS